jgi:hypothetical protein
MEYKTKFLACKDCGFEFEWRASDQQWIAECIEKGTPHPITGNVITEMKAPVRCQTCRAKRKAYFNEKNNKLKD